MLLKQQLAKLKNKKKGHTDSYCAPLAEQLAGRAVYGAYLFRKIEKNLKKKFFFGSVCPDPSFRIHSTGRQESRPFIILVLFDSLSQGDTSFGGLVPQIFIFGISNSIKQVFWYLFFAFFNKTQFLVLVNMNLVQRTRLQKELSKNINEKKSYGHKCVFWAYLHFKNFDFFNFDLNLQFTLVNSQSSIGNSNSGRIGQNN